MLFPKSSLSPRRLACFFMTLVVVGVAFAGPDRKPRLEVAGRRSDTLFLGESCVVRLGEAVHGDVRISLSGTSQVAYISSGGVAFLVSGVAAEPAQRTLLVEQRAAELFKARVILQEERVCPVLKEMRANALEVFARAEGKELKFLVSAPAIPWKFTVEVVCEGLTTTHRESKSCEVNAGHVAGEFRVRAPGRYRVSVAFRVKDQANRTWVRNYVMKLKAGQGARFIRGFKAHTDIEIK
jgi:hypothetical protein